MKGGTLGVIAGFLAIGALLYAAYDWYTNGFQWWDGVLIGAGVIFFPIPNGIASKL